MTRLQLINSIIQQMDLLVDLRGVEKCRVILDIIGKLAALRESLKTEEKDDAD